MTLRRSGGRLFRALFAILFVYSVVCPASSSAQTDERMEANHLYGAFMEMGSAHMAAFLGAKVQLMQALTYLIGAANSSKCIDPNPWIQILNNLQAGATAQSVFPAICALTEMPTGSVLNQVNRYRCRCEGETLPPVTVTSISGTWKLVEGYCAPGELITITQTGDQVTSIRSKGTCSGGEYAEYEATNIQWQPGSVLTYRAVYTVKPPTWPEPYAAVTFRFLSNDKAVGEWRKNGKSGSVTMERVK